jgi:hypothetical protein
VALIGYRLIGYRMMDMARRMQAANVVAVEPLWICPSCRSANELRLLRCYRCGRDAADDIELVIDHRSTAPTFFEVPAGSPFATLGVTSNKVSDEDPSAPVMVDPSGPVDPTPEESDRPADGSTRAAFTGVIQTRGRSYTVEAGEPASRNDLASALRRRI